MLARHRCRSTQETRVKGTSGETCAHQKQQATPNEVLSHHVSGISERLRFQTVILLQHIVPSAHCCGSGPESSQLLSHFYPKRTPPPAEPRLSTISRFTSGLPEWLISLPHQATGILQGERTVKLPQEVICNNSNRRFTCLLRTSERPPPILFLHPQKMHFLRHTFERVCADSSLATQVHALLCPPEQTRTMNFFLQQNHRKN